jgi:DNA-binding GntR family transcriptional regulator
MLRDEPVRSMQEKAYSYLLKRMLSRELVAGVPLSEVSLAKELGISRTPLREALRRLAAEGLLRQIPNRGTMVVEYSKRDIFELYELREALELYAAGKAAEHGLRPADRMQLEQLVSDLLVLRDELLATGQGGLNVEQMQRFVQVDLSFHTALLRTAANRRILKVVSDTHVLLNIFAMPRQGHTAVQLAEIHRYHNEIVQALVRKEPEAAKRLMREHIQISQRERLREFDEWDRHSALGSSLSSAVDWNQASGPVSEEF